MPRDDEVIELDVLGGDGAVLDIEGPRTTTSLRYRRVPLTEPDEQLRVLDDAARAASTQIWPPPDGRS